MTQQMVECIANFSEGRRQEVIDAIRAAVAGVPGVHVLDVHSDADHNRSVITFAGTPGGVAEAAFQCTAKAAELIDMQRQRGEHPRIGATDVVPFVPLKGITMAECVTLARQVGRRIGEELGLPVYLYEQAATRSERKNLAHVRRGEYEGLKVEIERDPARAPDFGPARLGRAGAVVVGARPPLIAYNVYLNTSDVEVARKVAKAIRHLSGGLRFVKAIGLLVDGRAQVSMNMVDYGKTPLQRAFELIRAEAARYGAVPTESEIVGLVPEDALFDAVEHYLQLNRFRREQVLERRLLAVLASSGEDSGEEAASALPPWVPLDTMRALAAGVPAAGGAASAIAAGLASSLGQLATRLLAGREEQSGSAELREQLARLEALGLELAQLSAEDSRAGEALAAARRLRREDAEQRAAGEAALQEALTQATRVPLSIAERSVEVLSSLRAMAERGTRRDTPVDIRVAALLAHAAVAGAAYEAEAQSEAAADPALHGEVGGRAAGLREAAAELLAATLNVG